MSQLKKILNSILTVFSIGSVLVLLAPQLAVAEDEGISTDRPDFVESSDTVGKGRWQIETSWAYARGRDDGGVHARETSTPTLLRWGFSENWEARLETDGRLYTRISDASGSLHDNGWADVSLGLKWHARDGEEDSGQPGLGLLMHVDMDTGSRHYRGQGWRPSLRGVAEWEWSDGWGLGVMPGLVHDRTEDNRDYLAGIFGIVIGKRVSEQLRFFGEIAMEQIASNTHGGTPTTFDFGLTYLLSKEMQVDFSVNKGLNNEAPDWNAAVGFSMRF